MSKWRASTFPGNNGERRRRWRSERYRRHGKYLHRSLPLLLILWQSQIRVEVLRTDAFHPAARDRGKSNFALNPICHLHKVTFGRADPIDILQFSLLNYAFFGLSVNKSPLGFERVVSTLLLPLCGCLFIGIKKGLAGGRRLFAPENLSTAFCGWGCE